MEKGRLIRMAIVILADTQTHADVGRAVNALLALKRPRMPATRFGSFSMGTGPESSMNYRLSSTIRLPFEAIDDQITGVCPDVSRYWVRRMASWSQVPPCPTNTCNT